MTWPSYNCNNYQKTWETQGKPRVHNESLDQYLYVYFSMSRTHFLPLVKLDGRQIGEFIEQMGENFESIMTSCFEEFKKSLNKGIGFQCH